MIIQSSLAASAVCNWHQPGPSTVSLIAKLAVSKLRSPSPWLDSGSVQKAPFKPTSLSIAYTSRLFKELCLKSQWIWTNQKAPTLLLTEYTTFRPLWFSRCPSCPSHLLRWPHWAMQWGTMEPPCSTCFIWYTLQAKCRARAQRMTDAFFLRDGGDVGQKSLNDTGARHFTIHSPRYLTWRRRLLK